MTKKTDPKDIDLKKIFQEEENITEEGSENATRQDFLLNDNTHMHGGKDHVSLDAGKNLTTEDVRNFTDPNTFKVDDSRDSTIVFFCKECRHLTPDRPIEKKKGSYNFICPKCKAERMAWGTITSIKNQYKIISTS